ncbi:MAG: hypothetical protein ACU0CO_05440 [Shimia sp.]
MEVLLAFVGAFAFAVWIAIVLPIGMAQARGRRWWVWLLVSVCLWPLLAFVGLLILGPAEDP